MLFNDYRDGVIFDMEAQHKPQVSASARAERNAQGRDAKAHRASYGMHLLSAQVASVYPKTNQPMPRNIIV